MNSPNSSTKMRQPGTEGQGHNSVGIVMEAAVGLWTVTNQREKLGPGKSRDIQHWSCAWAI